MLSGARLGCGRRGREWGRGEDERVLFMTVCYVEGGVGGRVGRGSCMTSRRGGDPQGEITCVLCVGTAEGRRGDRGASKDGRRAGGCCRVSQVHTLEPLSVPKVVERLASDGDLRACLVNVIELILLD